MSKKLKILAYIFLSLIILAIVGALAAIYIGGYLIDNKLDSVVARLEKKVPNLKLDVEILDKSFTSREGRIYYTYTLPKNNPLNTEKLVGAADFSVNLGLLNGNAHFKKAVGVGNFDEIFKSLNLEPINYNAVVSGSIWNLDFSGAFKTDSFNLPFSDGLCHIGENSFFFKLLNTNKASIEFSSAGISCKSEILYNKKTAFDVLIKNLALSTEPQMVNNKVYIPYFKMGLKEAHVDASTLYLIGFDPHEKVKDPSVREAFYVKDLGLTVKLDDEDKHKRRELYLEGVGNLSFAFPYIRENKPEPLYEMQNIRYESTLGRVDFASLVNYLKKGSFELSELLSFVSESPFYKLDNFSYEHKGEVFKVKGEVLAKIIKDKVDPASISADFDVKGGQYLIEDIASSDYKEALEQQVERGAIDFDGKFYHSKLKFSKGAFSLNGLPLTSSEQITDSLSGEVE